MMFIQLAKINSIHAIFYHILSFYYFYTDVLCTVRGSRQCRTKSNIEKFYNFCATLLILHTMANSAQNSSCTGLQNSDIHTLR